MDTCASVTQSLGNKYIEIWIFGKADNRVFNIWILWRFAKVNSILMDVRLYSSVSYVYHSYLCPYSLDFIHQGLRKVKLIFEDDIL